MNIPEVVHLPTDSGAIVTVDRDTLERTRADATARAALTRAARRVAELRRSGRDL